MHRKKRDLNWHLFAMQNIYTSLPFGVLVRRWACSLCAGGWRMEKQERERRAWNAVTVIRAGVHFRRELFFMQFKHSSLSYELVSIGLGITLRSPFTSFIKSEMGNWKMEMRSAATDAVYSCFGTRRCVCVCVCSSTVERSKDTYIIYFSLAQNVQLKNAVHDFDTNVCVCKSMAQAFGHRFNAHSTIHLLTMIIHFPMVFGCVVVCSLIHSLCCVCTVASFRFVSFRATYTWNFILNIQTAAATTAASH